MGDTGDPWSRSDEGGKDQKSNQKENKNNKKQRNQPTKKKTKNVHNRNQLP